MCFSRVALTATRERRLRIAEFWPGETAPKDGGGRAAGAGSRARGSGGIRHAQRRSGPSRIFARALRDPWHSRRRLRALQKASSFGRLRQATVLVTAPTLRRCDSRPTRPVCQCQSVPPGPYKGVFPARCTCDRETCRGGAASCPSLHDRTWTMFDPGVFGMTSQVKPPGRYLGICGTFAVKPPLSEGPCPHDSVFVCIPCCSQYSV